MSSTRENRVSMKVKKEPSPCESECVLACVCVRLLSACASVRARVLLPRFYASNRDPLLREVEKMGAMSREHQ